MRYVRIYADADGESHFEDVEVGLVPQGDTWSKARAERSEPFPVAAAYFRRVIGDDESGEPHVAPRRQLLVNLEGECEIRVSDGEVRRFGAQSIVLVEDTTGVGHWTRMLGSGEISGLVIALAEESS